MENMHPPSWPKVLFSGNEHVKKNWNNVVPVYLGGLSRAFTGVASGATRAALTQHFALENNAADVSAKEGSQETMATMTGMGMLMAHVTGRHPIANDKVLSPLEVSRTEHVFLVWTSWQSSSGAESLHWHVYLAVKASSLKHSDAMELSGAVSTQYKRAKYQLLGRVIIHKEATPADILQFYINALILASLVDKTQSLHAESRLWMEEHYPVFIAKLQSAGWATEWLLSQSIVWRADWFCNPLDEKILKVAEKNQILHYYIAKY